MEDAVTYTHQFSRWRQILEKFSWGQKALLPLIFGLVLSTDWEMAFQVRTNQYSAGPWVMLYPPQVFSLCSSFPHGVLSPHLQPPDFPGLSALSSQLREPWGSAGGPPLAWKCFQSRRIERLLISRLTGPLPSVAWGPGSWKSSFCTGCLLWLFQAWE